MRKTDAASYDVRAHVGGPKNLRDAGPRNP